MKNRLVFVHNTIVVAQHMRKVKLTQIHLQWLAIGPPSSRRLQVLTKVFLLWIPRTPTHILMQLCPDLKKI